MSLKLGIDPVVLQRLSGMSSELDSLSDGFNVKIRHFEGQIRGAGVHVTAEVPIDPDTKLMWARVNDTWGLCIHEMGDKNLPSERYELVKAQRDLRLTALKFIPALLDALVKRTQVLIDQVKAAGRAEP